jgi:hypothetical protein
VTRLALLPLDDRPANYDHPWWLGRAAGIEVLRPPREWLGSPLRRAAPGRLADWLGDEGASADGLVIAIDTLAYGGLIPSRQSETTLDSVIDLLALVRSLRAAHRELPIFAFSILMRVNRTNAAEEEKPYWATYGRNLFRLSYLDDKTRVGDASEREVAELKTAVDTVPADVVANYRAGRTRNHAINRLMIEWLEDGIIDYAVIAQDDTAPYGWNIGEARALRELIERRGLTDRAIVYPGADEVAGLLVAAFACRRAGLRPRVWTRYSGTDGPSMVTAYEDRPLQELVKAHLGPLGGGLGSSADDADLVLAINAPAEAQAEAWLQLAVREPARVPPQFDTFIDAEAARAAEREMTSPRRDVSELIRATAADIEAGGNVAVVDVAFVNGADLTLADYLLERVPIARLAAYAAWNTAGNSLGSALAQGVVRAVTRRHEQSMDVVAAHLGLLAIHLLDDYAFQSIVRSELLLEDLPAFGLPPTFERLRDSLLPEIEDVVRRRLAPYVEEVGRKLAMVTVPNGPAQCRLTGLRIDPPTLPWKRVFEVAIWPRIELEPA